MRIIRPQQLAVLKNSYQIGRDSYMGISVVAGVYLSRPSHFVTEAQIWQAWKAAPISFRVLDSAEPKPFAEFLLAGHAGIGEEVSALDVTARVGPLERRWRVEGESGMAGMHVKPFMRMPMDHSHSWGGPDCKDNPLGRGHSDKRHPTLMSINVDGSAQVRSPLAAPTPLPPNFQVRQQYMDLVAPEMTDKHYLETCFPGLPLSINRRYFQMAPPSQWLKKAQWPQNVDFELHGFRPDHAVLAGTFPAVQARAFAWPAAHEEPQELVMQLKTLWLLPDDDIGLMVFTGHIPLSHLFDEPVAALMVALDPAQAPRDEAHYLDVYARRSREGAPSFEFLNDPDLMAQGMSLNVIRDLADHPDSRRYSARPQAEQDVAHFYQDVNEAIARYQRLQTPPQPSGQESHAVNGDELPFSVAGDSSGEIWLQENHRDAQNMTFHATDFSGHVLTNKQFRYCTFHHCNFAETRLVDCTFEQCRFIWCGFTHSVLENVCLTNCLFSHSRIQDARVERGTWEKVNVESCGFQMSRFDGCTWAHNVVMEGDFSQCRFEACALNNSFFSASTLSGFAFEQGHITACVFEKCLAQAATFNGSTLEKNSLVGGGWQESRFTGCRLNSFTTGLDINLSGVRFEQCSMCKIGFTRACLQDSHFQHCTLLEACCDKANLDSANVADCDMAGLRLKDALLTRSTWRATSLQQSMLYNADLRDAAFKQCNFAGANLAMVSQNVMTRFERCLMEQTHWLPRRYRVSA